MHDIQVTFENKVSKTTLNKQIQTRDEINNVYFEPLNKAPLANWTANFTVLIGNVCVGLSSIHLLHKNYI